MSRPFCMDTSSLIWAFREAYPMDVVPGVWTSLDSAIKSKEVISVELVFDEIKRGEDGLYKWVKERSDFFKKVDQQVMGKMPILMKNFPRLVDPLSLKDEADPYLIALAQTQNGIVVTQEKPLKNSPKRMKIPDVCKKLGIEYIDFLAMIRRFGWKYK